MSAVPEVAAVPSVRCLVVDANPASRERVLTAIASEACGRVAGAADAYAAFRLTQASADWDVVVINLDAAGLNGFEVYSQLRAAVGRDLAVVFLTARPGGRSVSVAANRPAVPLRQWSGPGALVGAIRAALAWAAD